ncbi:hypothetical protein [Saccharopolyspora spinosa]|nr:hypothetical protein [Saccharopolyspora spinosa]
MMAALTTATAINLGYAWTLGILADRVGKRRVSCAGRVAHVVVAVPLCWLVDTGAFAGIVAGPLLARRREGRPARQRDGVQQCLRS